MPPLPNLIEISGVVRAAGRVTLDYMADDELQQILIDGGPIRDHLIAVIRDADALVPEGTEWRIHITGDLPASVKEIDAAIASTPYTVERGANTVAGKTIDQGDGTFDVLVSPLIWNLHDDVDVQQSLNDMAARVRHTFMHEAFHVAFHARREDALSALPSVDHLDWFEQVWSRHLGFMLEDYRIEAALKSLAPWPHSRVSQIGGELAHFEAERARSFQVGSVQGDPAGGRDVMIQAGADITQCLAYLAAETDDPTPFLADADLERWNRFIAPTWKEWLATYKLALPGNDLMTPAAVAAVIGRLGALGPRFLLSVGFERKMDANIESAWWLYAFSW